MKYNIPNQNKMIGIIYDEAPKELNIMLDNASPIIPVSLADIKAYSKKKDIAQQMQPNNNLLLFLYSSNCFFVCLAIKKYL